MNLPTQNAKGRMREPGVMNGTEKRYAELLERRRISGEVLWWKFEAIAFRLADERCFYHPDFMVMMADTTIEIHEVKGGFIRDDGRDKLKIAAALFPFVFRRCVWKDGKWTITEMGRSQPRRQAADAQSAARGMEAPKGAKREAVRREARQPGPKDAPGKLKYDGGDIPKDKAVVNGFLVPRSEALAMIMPKKTA